MLLAIVTHERMHQKGLDGPFCDEKSKLINDKFEESLAELKQEAERLGLSEDTIDENKVFIDVLNELGCIEKDCVYGIGNSISSITSDSSFSSTVKIGMQPPMSQEDTTELMCNIIMETLGGDVLKENINQAIASSMPVYVQQNLQQSFQPTVKQVLQSNMEHIVETVATQLETRNTQSRQSHPAEGDGFEGVDDNDVVNVMKGVNLEDLQNY